MYVILGTIIHDIILADWSGRRTAPKMDSDPISFLVSSGEKIYRYTFEY